MYRNIEAQVAIAKCKESKKIYGVRMEKTPSGWEYNWAFPISEKRAKSEKYESTKIIGNIHRGKDYPGCPYCGAMGFVVCSSCKKLNCYNDGEKWFTCQWCGSSGGLEDYDGTGISSSGDV